LMGGIIGGDGGWAAISETQSLSWKAQKAVKDTEREDEGGKKNRKTWDGKEKFQKIVQRKTRKRGGSFIQLLKERKEFPSLGSTHTSLCPQ
jgi:hypothetical protein